MHKAKGVQYIRTKKRREKYEKKKKREWNESSFKRL